MTAEPGAHLFGMLAIALPFRAQGHFLDGEACFLFGVIHTDGDFILQQPEVDVFGQGYQLVGTFSAMR